MDVRDKDHTLEFEICELWFHTKCQDVSDSEYEFLSDHKSVHWYCEVCNRNVAKVIKMVSGIRLKQERLEEAVKKITEDVASLSADINNTKQSVCTVDKAVKGLANGTFPEGMRLAIEEVVVNRVRRNQSYRGRSKIAQRFNNYY